MGLWCDEWYLEARKKGDEASPHKVGLFQRVKVNRTFQCLEKTWNQTLNYRKHLFRKKVYTTATPKVFQCVQYTNFLQEAPLSFIETFHNSKTRQCKSVPILILNM